jgi:propionyl-CoA carboxylase alpha chain
MIAAAVALHVHRRTRPEAVILPHIPANYRNNPFRDPSIKLEINGQAREISYRSTTDNSFAVRCGDWQADARLVSSEHGNGPGSIRLAIDGVQSAFRIAEAGDQLFVQCGSLSRMVSRMARYPRAQSASEHESAYAPMPGQVLRVLVSVGQQVSAGDPLMILEAMKMEQTLRASTDGVVEAVLVKPGDVVAPGDTLVGIKSLATDEHR